jgi:hemerythrin-like domain-containing protein
MKALEPLGALIKEHRLFERIFHAVEAMLFDSRRTSVEFCTAAADFLIEFAHGSHAVKEEERMFPLLWERGVPLENGPLALIMDEHRKGLRKLVSVRETLAKGAVEKETAAGLHSEFMEYLSFMRQHIQKEEQRIFNVARTLLDSEDMAWLQREFAEVEREYIGSARHKQYLAWVNMQRKLAGFPNEQ